MAYFEDVCAFFFFETVLLGKVLRSHTQTGNCLSPWSHDGTIGMKELTASLGLTAIKLEWGLGHVD